MLCRIESCLVVSFGWGFKLWFLLGGDSDVPVLVLGQVNETK